MDNSVTADRQILWFCFYEHFNGRPSFLTRIVRQPLEYIEFDAPPRWGIISKCAGLYRAGLSLKQISAQVRQPKTTVRNAIRRAGIELRMAPSAREYKTKSQGRPGWNSSVRFLVAPRAPCGERRRDRNCSLDYQALARRDHLNGHCFPSE